MKSNQNVCKVLRVITWKEYPKEIFAISEAKISRFFRKNGEATILLADIINEAIRHNCTVSFEKGYYNSCNVFENERTPKV